MTKIFSYLILLPIKIPILTSSSIDVRIGRRVKGGILIKTTPTSEEIIFKVLHCIRLQQVQ